MINDSKLVESNQSEATEPSNTENVNEDMIKPMEELRRSTRLRKDLRDTVFKMAEFLYWGECHENCTCFYCCVYHISSGFFTLSSLITIE